MKLSDIYRTIRRLAPATAAAAALTLGSCRQEICYDHEGLTSVGLSYELAWERDFGAAWADTWDSDAMGRPYADLLPAKPTSLTLMSYAEGRSPFRAFVAPQGGPVTSLPEGDVLIYNDDTEYVVLQDIASLPEASATTTGRSRSTLAPLHSGERTVNPPDVIFAAFRPGLPAAQSHRTDTLALTLRPLVYTYIIEYTVDAGLDLVGLARGALAGMAENVRLRTADTGPEAATLLFDCTPGEPDGNGNGVITAVVRSFGVPAFAGSATEAGPAPAEGSFTLNLEVMLRSGAMQQWEFDVTRQLAHQPRGGVIRVGGVVVVDESNQVDSGFDVDVDDWGDYSDVVLPPFEF